MTGAELTLASRPQAGTTVTPTLAYDPTGTRRSQVPCGLIKRLTSPSAAGWSLVSRTQATLWAIGEGIVPSLRQPS
jgi:hypothetical protein